METVLVVDDCLDLRSIVVEYLGTFTRYKVMGEAGDGLEAIRLVEEQRPDLVLMDVWMPELDGIKATQVIKEKWPEAVVITYSGAHERDVEFKALEAGATLHITKPLDFAQLIASMDEVLDVGV